MHLSGQRQGSSVRPLGSRTFSTSEGSCVREPHVGRATAKPAHRGRHQRHVARRRGQHRHPRHRGGGRHGHRRLPLLLPLEGRAGRRGAAQHQQAELRRGWGHPELQLGPGGGHPARPRGLLEPRRGPPVGADAALRAHPLLPAQRHRAARRAGAVRHLHRRHAALPRGGRTARGIAWRSDVEDLARYTVATLQGISIQWLVTRDGQHARTMLSHIASHLLDDAGLERTGWVPTE